MLSLFNTYPRWAAIPGRRNAVIYISPDQPADVVSYGVRLIHGKPFPIVKFSGFSEDENAGALSMQRLGEAMKMMINHAARSCRLPTNHSGKVAPLKTYTDGMYKIVSVPVYQRASDPKQVYIKVRIWESGPANDSVVVTCPQIVFWDVPTMAQFETVCFRVAQIAREVRPGE